MEKKDKARQEIEIVLESLSPNERKVLPFLNKDFEWVLKKSELDETSVLRALEFLSNKKLLELKIEEKKTIELGINGILYKKHGLPERKLINLVADKTTLSLNEAKKQSGLNDNEFQASLGALKKKALVNIANGNVVLSGSKEEIARKTLEEHFLDSLPRAFESLKPEEKYSLDKLKDRKNIIEVNLSKNIGFSITDLGKKIISSSENFKEEMLETLSPEIIANGSWKGKRFRRYDITSNVPRLSGGKRHFVDQARDYARKVWSELGFKEMSGNLCQTGFWNFDALFTAQDHPVREIQDTFYIKEIKGKLPEKRIMEAVKLSHEKGIGGSKGWRYSWKEEESRRVILRTHTTCLSAQTLGMLGKMKDIKDKKGKFFAVGKCFRNETIDWGHLFEFNQTEGIVVDKNANFRNLLGYLAEFFRKMGFEKVKFVPSYFPYTEPSVEIYGYNTLRKTWIEIGGAGIMRPEVVIPLLGEYVPVLAWGPGFDRSIMEYYNLDDLRNMYSNDLTKLREMKFWRK